MHNSTSFPGPVLRIPRGPRKINIYLFFEK
nr:MAG TPA: hypothetical protein [Caudoviricetes sp.]